MTNAVHEHLYYRRSTFGSKLLWIDTVCINQNDPDEKERELPLMLDIYRRAVRVLVWLGPPPGRMKETRIFRRLIHRIGLPILSAATSRTAVVQSLFREKDQKEAFFHLNQLFNHPWFKRIWVAQEVAAGRLYMLCTKVSV